MFSTARLRKLLVQKKNVFPSKVTVGKLAPISWLSMILKKIVKLYHFMSLLNPDAAAGEEVVESNRNWESKIKHKNI